MPTYVNRSLSRFFIFFYSSEIQIISYMAKVPRSFCLPRHFYDLDVPSLYRGCWWDLFTTLHYLCMRKGTLSGLPIFESRLRAYALWINMFTLTLHIHICA